MHSHVHSTREEPAETAESETLAYLEELERRAVLRKIRRTQDERSEPVAEAEADDGTY